jgi:hypothetical protein
MEQLRKPSTNCLSLGTITVKKGEEEGRKRGREGEKRNRKRKLNICNANYVQNLSYSTPILVKLLFKVQWKVQPFETVMVSLW